jgi:hypothetical protein
LIAQRYLEKFPAAVTLDITPGRRPTCGAARRLEALTAVAENSKGSRDRERHLFPRGDDGAELAAAEKAFLTR